MYYKKNDIKFIRFGGLNPVKQSGNTEEYLHSAPVKKGFYAFIYFMIEPFLLGGYNPIGTKYSKRKYIKDSKGNKIIMGRYFEDKTKPPVEEGDDYFEWYVSVTEEESDYLIKRYANKQTNLFYTYGSYDEKGFVYLETMVKPKRFKYTGNIWHHHKKETPRHLIIKETEFWVLTDFNTFVKSFNKALHNKLKYNHSWSWKYKDIGITSIRNKQFNKDIFEVFIERL